MKVKQGIRKSVREWNGEVDKKIVDTIYNKVEDALTNVKVLVLGGEKRGPVISFDDTGITYVYNNELCISSWNDWEGSSNSITFIESSEKEKAVALEFKNAQATEEDKKAAWESKEVTVNKKEVLEEVSEFIEIIVKEVKKDLSDKESILGDIEELEVLSDNKYGEALVVVKFNLDSCPVKFVIPLKYGVKKADYNTYSSRGKEYDFLSNDPVKIQLFVNEKEVSLPSSKGGKSYMSMGALRSYADIKISVSIVSSVINNVDLIKKEIKKASVGNRGGDSPISSEKTIKVSGESASNLKAFVNKIIKELDSDGELSTFFIDTPAEYKKFDIQIPGICLVCTDIEETQQSLKNKEIVKKFDKSKTLKRYSAWKRGKVPGIQDTVWFTIYVSAKEARDNNIESLHEEYFGYIDEDGDVICMQGVVNEDCSDARITDMEDLESSFVRYRVDKDGDIWVR